jgi:hypothetical protein
LTRLSRSVVTRERKRKKKRKDPTEITWTFGWVIMKCARISQNSLVSSTQAIYGVAYAMRDISSASTEKKGILNDLLFQYFLRRHTEYYV